MAGASFDPPSPSFFGLPARLTAGKPVLFGVPSSLGSPHLGSANGPYFLRRMTQRFTRASSECALIDIRQGNTSIEGAADVGDIKIGASLTELVADIETVVREFPSGSVPIAVGGDHSITFPIVRALQASLGRPLTVVCFDHHLDHQYWARPLDPLFHTNVMTHVSETIGVGRLIQIGIEPVQTASMGLAEWYVTRLAKVGRQIALLTPEIEDDAAVLAAVGRDGDVYVSVDVDVLPRHQMRATAYPSDIGLSLERMVSMIQLIATHNRIVGADLVEFAANRNNRDPEILADAARASILLYELLRVATNYERALIK
jgi:arginase family enzyme